MRGFKTLKTAYAAIMGQAGASPFKDGVVGEARPVERAFALGPCALTDVMAPLQDSLVSAQAQGDCGSSPTTSPLRQVCNRAIFRAGSQAGRRRGLRSHRWAECE